MLSWSETNWFIDVSYVLSAIDQSWRAKLWMCQVCMCVSVADLHLFGCRFISVGWHNTNITCMLPRGLSEIIKIFSLDLERAKRIMVWILRVICMLWDATMIGILKHSSASLWWVEMHADLPSWTNGFGDNDLWFTVEAWWLRHKGQQSAELFRNHSALIDTQTHAYPIEKLAVEPSPVGECNSCNGSRNNKYHASHQMDQALRFERLSIIRP